MLLLKKAENFNADVTRTNSFVEDEQQYKCVIDKCRTVQNKAYGI